MIWCSSILLFIYLDSVFAIPYLVCHKIALLRGSDDVHWFYSANFGHVASMLVHISLWCSLICDMGICISIWLRQTLFIAWLEAKCICAMSWIFLGYSGLADFIVGQVPPSAKRFHADIRTGDVFAIDSLCRLCLWMLVYECMLNEEAYRQDVLLLIFFL